MALIINRWEIHGGNHMLSNDLLEARDMKDVMDLASNGELQLICYLFNMKDHPVWPIELRLKIFIPLLL